MRPVDPAGIVHVRYRKIRRGDASVLTDIGNCIPARQEDVEIDTEDSAHIPTRLDIRLVASQEFATTNVERSLGLPRHDAATTWEALNKSLQ